MSHPSTTSFEPTKGFGGIENGDLKWYCPPDGWKSDDADLSSNKKEGWWKIEESRLLLAPHPRKDFWRKTYYQPLLVKDDGPFLYRTVSLADLPVTIETSFTITGQSSQFDQGGILIRLDHEHWLKTGIEIVDEQARLSCVVTNCFSDWSTQIFPQRELKIRVHILPQHGGSFVVEAAPFNSDDWAFIRIAHINRNMKHDLLNNHETVQSAYQGEDPPDNSMWVGVFGACPIDQKGTVVTFHDLSIVQGSTFVHDC